jgi:hypothetical protein
VFGLVITEFWLRLAHRWEELLQARKRGTRNIEVPTRRFERATSTKRRRAVSVATMSLINLRFD